MMMLSGFGVAPFELLFMISYCKFDFVVSRAVMPLPDLMKLIRKNIRKEQHNALPNGLLCLKGGDLHEELKPFKNIVEVYPLNDFFDEEWYRENKKIIYVPIG